MILKNIFNGPGFVPVELVQSTGSGEYHVTHGEMEVYLDQTNVPFRFHFHCHWNQTYWYRTSISIISKDIDHRNIPIYFATKDGKGYMLIGNAEFNRWSTGYVFMHYAVKTNYDGGFDQLLDIDIGNVATNFSDYSVEKTHDENYYPSLGRVNGTTTDYDGYHTIGKFLGTQDTGYAKVKVSRGAVARAIFEVEGAYGRWNGKVLNTNGYTSYNDYIDAFRILDSGSVSYLQLSTKGALSNHETELLATDGAFKLEPYLATGSAGGGGVPLEVSLSRHEPLTIINQDLTIQGGTHGKGHVSSSLASTASFGALQLTKPYGTGPNIDTTEGMFHISSSTGFSISASGGYFMQDAKAYLPFLGVGRGFGRTYDSAVARFPLDVRYAQAGIAGTNTSHVVANFQRNTGAAFEETAIRLGGAGGNTGSLGVKLTAQRQGAGGYNFYIATNNSYTAGSVTNRFSINDTGEIGINLASESRATTPLQVEGNISSSGNFITTGDISGSITSTASFNELKLKGNVTNATAFYGGHYDDVGKLNCDGGDISFAYDTGATGSFIIGNSNKLKFGSENNTYQSSLHMRSYQSIIASGARDFSVSGRTLHVSAVSDDNGDGGRFVRLSAYDSVTLNTNKPSGSIFANTYHGAFGFFSVGNDHTYKWAYTGFAGHGSWGQGRGYQMYTKVNSTSSLSVAVDPTGSMYILGVHPSQYKTYGNHLTLSASNQHNFSEKIGIPHRNGLLNPAQINFAFMSTGMLGIGERNPTQALLQISGAYAHVTHSNRVYVDTGSFFITHDGYTHLNAITGGLVLEASGSDYILSSSNVFEVQGSTGRLFSVSDTTSGSIFSATTQAGLPAINALSDSTVELGPHSKPITVSSTGDISGSATSTGSVGTLQVPGGNDFGIGLHIHDGTVNNATPNPNPSANGILIESPTNTGMTIHSGGGSVRSGAIAFTAADRGHLEGVLRYSHVYRRFEMDTEDVPSFQFDGGSSPILALVGTANKIQFGSNANNGGIESSGGSGQVITIGDVEDADTVQEVILKVWAGNKYLKVIEDGVGIDKDAEHPLDVNGTARATTLIATGNLSKGSGTFTIPHPNPSKTNTHKLQHSFVESPTRGDNLYRWKKQLVEGDNIITLPDYYKYLNENDMVWVNPVGHFGRGYGSVNEEQTEINIVVDTSGEYNVLCIGTRKDKVATENFEGVEIKST